MFPVQGIAKPLTIVGIIGVLFGARAWYGLGPHTLKTVAVIVLGAFLTHLLATGIVLVLIALGGERSVIRKHLRLRRQSLAAVEGRYPPLPRTLEIIGTAARSVAIFVLCLQFASVAYADSAGPNSPVAGADDPSIGTVAWSNPGSITASDDSRATADLPAVATTHYLVATDFGFNIPLTATVTGIQVEWEKSLNSGAGALADSAVRIVKGGIVGSNDRSDGSTWPSTDTYVAYGTTNDLWGTTWTPADINASTFGAAIAAVETIPLRSASAGIDYVRLTVSYTLPGGGGDMRILMGFGIPKKASPTAAPPPATITGATFLDLNGNGRRDVGERRVAVAEVKVTAGNGEEDASAVSDKDGRFSLPLAGGSRPYVLNVDPKTLGAFEPTRQARLSVGAGEQQAAELGVRWKQLVRHTPCLVVDPGNGSREGSDARRVLSLLEDPSGRRVAGGIDRKAGLVRREDFAWLLSNTQCAVFPRSGAEVRAALVRRNGRPFADLPINDNGKTLRAYGLVLAGVPVGSTRRWFDGKGYVTRAEAVTALAAAMELGDWRAGHAKDLAGVLTPADVSDPALRSAVQSLIALNVLPEGMRRTFNGRSGMTWGEAALLLDRAAFSAGRIDLRTSTRRTAQAPVFAHAIAGLQPCWQQDDSRKKTLLISDLSPGTPMLEDAMLLLSLGVPKGQATAWVIPGKWWAMDLGVQSGQMELSAAKSISIVELLRMLSVFSCLPPPSRTEAIQGRVMDSGTGEQLLKKDRIAGLNESAGLASRVLLNAQRPMRLDNLSPVFSFTDALVGKGGRAPGGPVSLREGSELVASTLLQMLVRQGVVNRAEAEETMAQLSHDLLAFMLSGTEGVNEQNTALTRGDVVKVLGAAARLAVREQNDQVPGTAEVWWQRLSESRLQIRSR
jgi:hypothetical protein